MKISKFAVFAAVCALPFSAAAQTNPVELEDWMNVEAVGSPQISPDGNAVIYSRAHVDQLNDRFNSALWIMDADGGRNRTLGEGGNAVWSPDGGRIAFTRNAGEEGSEIFVRWMDAEGAESQITWFEHSPQLLAWSPDGDAIAFRARVPFKSDWNIKLPDRRKGAKWTDEPVIIDSLHYRNDRVGYVEGFDHLFIVPAEGGTPRQITDGEWHVGARFSGVDAQSRFVWTPDGTHLVFDGMTEPDETGHPGLSHINKVNVETGEITQLTSSDGSWSGPSVSPDGEWIAYSGQQASTSTYPPDELRLVPVDGGDERVLVASLPNSVGRIFWDEDGDGLSFTMGYEGHWNVWHVDIDSGDLTQVTEGGHQLSLDSISEDGTAVGTISSPHIMSEVVRFDIGDGDDMQMLTSVNADIFADTDFGEVEEIWYNSPDGTRVQGWIVYPPDFDPDQTYPMILHIHGGPHAMYGQDFRFRFHDFAANGYVVLYTNPRGSTGYGADFANAIDNQYPGPADTQDLLAGVDAVIERGFIDENRLFATGCSGGGVLTSWLVTQTDRFAAAAALCPVINWIGFAGTADIVRWAYHRFHTPFWEDPTDWLDHSPLMHVDNVTTPTLLMTGNLDLRTPLAEAEEFYSALKMNGVPTKLVVMQDEYHGTTSKPSNLLRTQLILRKWFQDWDPAHADSDDE